jgi:hypothetical protein
VSPRISFRLLSLLSTFLFSITAHNQMSEVIPLAAKRAGSFPAFLLLKWGITIEKAKYNFIQTLLLLQP